MDKIKKKKNEWPRVDFSPHSGSVRSICCFSSVPQRGKLIKGTFAVYLSYGECIYTRARRIQDPKKVYRISRSGSRRAAAGNSSISRPGEKTRQTAETECRWPGRELTISRIFLFFYYGLAVFLHTYSTYMWEKKERKNHFHFVKPALCSRGQGHVSASINATTSTVWVKDKAISTHASPYAYNYYIGVSSYIRASCRRHARRRRRKHKYDDETTNKKIQHSIHTNTFVQLGSNAKNPPYLMVVDCA